MTEGAKDVNQAIVNVMRQVGYVQKEKTKGLMYSFASEAALIAAIRPAMLAEGLFCFVLDLLDVKRETYATKSGTNMISTLTHGVVRFMHAPSGTFIDVQATGEGADAGDKSANKAATGLLKYALRQTFLIETGDDPDKEAAEPNGKEPAKAGAWESNDVTPEIQLWLISKGFLPEGTHVKHAVGLLNLSPFKPGAGLEARWFEAYRAAREQGMNSKDAAEAALDVYMEYGV